MGNEWNKLEHHRYGLNYRWTGCRVWRRMTSDHLEGQQDDQESDPFVPGEIAYYIPPDPEGYAFKNATGNLLPVPNTATAEDVIVDNRGHICIDALH